MNYMDRNNVNHSLRKNGRWLFTAITVGFILSFKVFAFENGYTYLKKQENHTEIDWVIDPKKGDSPCFSKAANEALAQKIGLRCKRVIEHFDAEAGKQIESTFLMDSQNQSLYAQNLTTSGLDKVGKIFGIYFFRHQRGAYEQVYLLIDQHGRFSESYAAHGILNYSGLEPNATQKSSPYAGWLIPTSNQLNLSDCSQAIIKALDQEYLSNIDYYNHSDYRASLIDGELGNQLYMQIDMLTVPERLTDIRPIERNTALKALIQEQMEMAVGDREGEMEATQREARVKYLLFLTASAIDNRMLNELVTQYADVLGARMINIYRYTSECQ